MTDTPDEPDWSLLPRDPIRFFGLPEGFDRRELKRRYNELIRRFKPERHPEEFQRIRAAYEQLDSGIRYGLQTSWNAPTADGSWPVDFQAKTPTGPSFSRTTSPVLPLHERLQRENALDVYRELESKATKTAFDFYALAVMSDVVDPQDGKQFPRWLLQGLAVHQRDIGLLRLMNTYLRSSVDAKDAAPLLVKCSQIIHENTFFPLTEPLWRTLLRSQDFSLFRTTLQQCESNLKGVSIDGRIAFYLQILKSAMWVADEAWIDESLGFVETNFERIPQFLEFDVEMVTRLRTYIKHRSTFAAGHPLFRRMDQAMRDYFSEEQQTGDRSVLECQVQIVQDSDGLAEAFTNLVDPAYGPFYAVWGWISHDVAERNIESPGQLIDDDLWFSRTRTLLEQIARQTENSRFGAGWVLATMAYRCAQGLCYTAPIASFVVIFWLIVRRGDASMMGGRSAEAPNPPFVFGTILLIVAGALIGSRLTKQLKTRVWFPFCQWMSARCYRRLWRPEIIGFIGRSQVPYRSFVAYVSHTSNSVIARWDWVRHFVGLDFALPVYAMAQRFVV